MTTEELKLQLADTIEGLAATDRRLAGLSSSLMAMRLALRDVSPDRFESAYQKHFEGEECEAVRQSILTDAELLLALARMLKQSC